MADELEQRIAERRAYRERLDRADRIIQSYDRIARGRVENAPPMEPSAEDVALNSQANITVSAEWLAFMFEHLGANEMCVDLGRDEPLDLRPSEVYLHSTRSYEPREPMPLILQVAPWWRLRFWTRDQR